MYDHQGYLIAGTAQQIRHLQAIAAQQVEEAALTEDERESELTGDVVLTDTIAPSLPNGERPRQGLPPATDLSMETNGTPVVKPKGS